jgi:uncharacterized membrane protein YbaN (DUF454 family)
MNLTKFLFIIFGTISLGLGVMGIFIPGVPTTPFLLLAAALYLKSSVRLYRWITSHPLIGSYIADYHQAKGMSLKQKISAISIMWFMLILSVTYFIQSNTLKIFVIIVGIIGTLVMGLWVPTARRSPPSESLNEKDNP